METNENMNNENKNNEEINDSFVTDLTSKLDALAKEFNESSIPSDEPTSNETKTEDVSEKVEEIPQQEAPHKKADISTETIQTSVNTNVRVEEQMKLTPIKKKKKRKKKTSSRPKSKPFTFVLALLVWIGIFFALCGGIFGLWYTNKMLQDKPEFNASMLEANDSSIIYDVEGNQIMELGMYLRENIEYEDLPNCVVDAFVAIEDSRFFSHFGFDIPRFTKALLSNIANGNFGQGGSTITMQLVKNSYFQVDDGDNSTMASRSGSSGIKRKIQEIVLAIEANYTISKQETLMLFLNKVNFGDNIRGIQKAAEFYFGKDAKDLNLNEAAFLAGIINAPNAYNPYNELYKHDESYIYLSEDMEYLKNANERKNEVLNLMAYHGYITEEEAELNKKVKIENLVAGKEKKFDNTNTYYQSYIDAVIEEVEEVTGKSPYTTAMNIYTNMDPHMQEYVYNMQNNPELFEKYYTFNHDNQQNALVVMNNQTGELIALGGGRNQADAARQFNRAVDSYINPGSSIKPVIEYVLAFDKLGYSTSHTICDMPVWLYETDIAISNAYGQGYTGDMLITEALARSLNTPAIQLMDTLLDEYEEEFLIDYCKSIGFDYCNKNTFDIQWAIGGKDCLVSPVQLAGAHGMLINGGKYVAPHTVSRIEYVGKYSYLDDYVADTEGTQVVSPGAAYMTATLLENNVDSGWISQLNLLQRKYSVFAKTGTTNFSETAYALYNIPETGAKDQWLCCQTSNYTIVVWNGFDKLGEDAYFTVKDENYNLKCRMGSLLLNELMDYYNYDATSLEAPDDVIQIEHIKGCFPYAKPNETSTNVKGYILADSPYAELVNESDIQKEVKGGVLYYTAIVNHNNGTATVHWDEFNSYIRNEETGELRIDTSITSVSGKKTVIASGRAYYERFIFNNPDMFYATIQNKETGEEMAVESATPTVQVDVPFAGPYYVCGWTSANPTPHCTMESGYKEPVE